MRKFINMIREMIDPVNRVTVFPTKVKDKIELGFFDEHKLKVNDVIISSDGKEYMVTKVYRYSLWRKLLEKIGFRFYKKNFIIIREIKKQ